MSIRGPATKTPADLQRVVEAWPTLPPHLRAAFLALLDAAGAAKPAAKPRRNGRGA